MSVLPAAQLIESNQLEVEDLRALMQSVMETSERLQSTHVALQSQVSSLQLELAEANAKLRRSQSLAALGEMAAGIAHEIRNPLGSIQLYANVLAEDLAADQDHAELCTKISRAVVTMDSIVRDVLAFSRDMRLSIVEIDAEDLIRRSVAQCDALVEQHGLVLELDDVQPLPMAVDVTLMMQVLGNLVRNAIEAMHAAAVAAPRLVFRTSEATMRQVDGRRSTYSVLVLEDDGPGISDAVIERMFNPFFTTRNTGTGLGLAIVHRIIDAHGGQINVRNHQGGGARFELCLPRDVADAAANFEAYSDPDLEIEVRSPFGAGGAPASDRSAQPTPSEVSP